MRKKDKWKWREMQGIYDIYIYISIVDLQAHAKIQSELLHKICNAKQSKKRKRKERHEMKTNILGKRCV